MKLSLKLENPFDKLQASFLVVKTVV